MASNSKFHLTERTGFIIFTIVGFLFLIIGFFNIKTRLSAPFKIADTAITPVAQDQTVEALKTKDTDHDGLSDYDEIYLYNTSPYIADTDSDGMPDGVEVKQGTDPNCPKGKTCVVEENPVLSASSTTIIAPAPNIGSMNLNQSLSNMNGGADITAQGLRDALRQAGVDEATLKTIDDASLLKMYQDTVAAQNPPSSP